MSARRGARDVPAWHWIVAALGGLLLVGTVGFLLYESSRDSDGPPRLEVWLHGTYPGDGGFVVEAEVENLSRLTVADVVVEAELRAGGEREVATVTVDYVPGLSRRRVWFSLRGDPRAGGLAVRAIGYREP